MFDSRHKWNFIIGSENRFRAKATNGPFKNNLDIKHFSVFTQHNTPEGTLMYSQDSVCMLTFTNCRYYFKL